MSAAPQAPAPFVVGVGRSGTTLLRLMLDAHPALAIPTETHFLVTLLAAARESGSPDQALQAIVQADTWPNMGLDRDALAQALGALDPFTPGDAARAFFRLYAARFGKARWGDKSPPYRRVMGEIARELPEAHFIHIIRDGRDVALSSRGLWFGAGDDVEAQARFWVGEIGAARRQAETLAHYMELRFEDLVADPERELARICRFIDLPYDPAMVAYHQTARERMAEYVQPFGASKAAPVPLDRFLAIHDRTGDAPDSNRSGRWRSEMSTAEQGRYQAIAGPTLVELGYDLAD